MQTFGAVCLVVAAVGLALICLTIAPGILIRFRSIRRLKRRSTGRLVLTYDDGPGYRLEPRLLEILARHAARATFFPLGLRVEEARHRCRVLLAAGHELGSHSYRHLNAFKVLPWYAAADIGRGYSVLDEWLNRDAFFRPPYGKLTLWTWLQLRKRRARAIFWTLDCGDTQHELPDIPTVVRCFVEAGGGVALMHSFDRATDAHGEAIQWYVINLTDALLRAAHTHGFQVCTVSELERPAAGLNCRSCRPLPR